MFIDEKTQESKNKDNGFSFSSEKLSLKSSTESSEEKERTHRKKIDQNSKIRIRFKYE